MTGTVAILSSLFTTFGVVLGGLVKGAGMAAMALARLGKMGLGGLGGLDIGGGKGKGKGKLGKFLPKGLGIVGGAAALATGEYTDEEGNFSKEKTSETIGGAAVAAGGMWAGGKAGGAIGAFGGPIGAGVGALVGGIAGGLATTLLPDSIKKAIGDTAADAVGGVRDMFGFGNKGKDKDKKPAEVKPPEKQSSADILNKVIPSSFNSTKTAIYDPMSISPDGMGTGIPAVNIDKTQQNAETDAKIGELVETQKVMTSSVQDLNKKVSDYNNWQKTYVQVSDNRSNDILLANTAALSSIDNKTAPPAVKLVYG